MRVELDVAARMRDGAILRANVYRPEGGGPWPTLLTRTPYGKDDWPILTWLDPVQAARRGFMVVIQDTRGRYASEGEWTPFRFERKDGYDSVEWAARLPGSNGHVGMYGLSYFGNTQWMAAVEQPPSLAAISPSLTWSEPLDGLFQRGGALELGLAVVWDLLYSSGAGQAEQPADSERERQLRIAALFDDCDRLADAGYWELPARDMDVLRRHRVSDIGTFRMLAEPEVGGWPRIAGSHDRVTVPSLHIGGWHDIFAQGILDNYAAMAALGRPARLVMGPWTHVSFADPIGDLCFGLRSSRLSVPAHAEGDVNALQLAWLRRWLLPDQADEDSQAPARIFVMGRNEWRDESAWPPGRARIQRWHLAGDGALRPEDASPGEQVTEFVYDPANPAPTLGGQTVMAPSFPAGPFDQARIEARGDVCVFTSEPLQSDLEVTGRVRVVLHAQSSAASTDWVARLCDVHPDGRSFNLCDGIVRIGEGADALRRVEIDLWSTSNVFLAGHRLRVHVTSSCFPRWDRNLNTGRQDEPRFQVARQRIHHSGEHASWIELPVIAP